MQKTIKATSEMMDRTDFRTALQKGYFDLQRHLKWYTRRASEYNRDLMKQFIEVQTKMLTPFVPHICEEIWEKLGKKGFISLAEWPQFNEATIDEKIESAEEFVRGVVADIQEILGIARLQNPKTVYIYTTENWKKRVIRLIAGKDMKDAMRTVMQDAELRKMGKEVSAFVKKALSERILMEEMDEGVILQDANAFIEEEIGMKVSIDSDYDPQNKRRFAIPGRPAIYIE
jgi:leucyl-tRNA synthetase